MEETVQTGLPAGGADAPYKCFRLRRKPWRRGNSLAPSIEIPKGGATNGSETQKERHDLRSCLSFWWRRGESNSRPKTLPQELLRAQTVILGVLLSQFPFLPASRHADGSGELHRSWPVQSFAGARAPRNDACSRAVVLPGRMGC